MNLHKIKSHRVSAKGDNQEGNATNQRESVTGLDYNILAKEIVQPKKTTQHYHKN